MRITPSIVGSAGVNQKVFHASPSERRGAAAASGAVPGVFVSMRASLLFLPGERRTEDRLALVAGMLERPDLQRRLQVAPVEGQRWQQPVQERIVGIQQVALGVVLPLV